LGFCIKICIMPEENRKELSMSPPQRTIYLSQYDALATYIAQPESSDPWNQFKRSSTKPYASRSVIYVLWLPCGYYRNDKLRNCFGWIKRHFPQLWPYIDSSLPERTNFGNLSKLSSSEQQLTIITTKTTRKAPAE
jgi:hypothetical protein